MGHGFIQSFSLISIFFPCNYISFGLPKEHSSSHPNNMQGEIGSDSNLPWMNGAYSVSVPCLLFLFGQLRAYVFYFAFQGKIFRFLAHEVVAGKAQLGGGTFGGEQIEVGEFFAVAAEVVDFDEAFFEQGLEQKISLAQADAKALGQLALANFGFAADDIENAQLRLFAG